MQVLVCGPSRGVPSPARDGRVNRQFGSRFPQASSPPQVHARTLTAVDLCLATGALLGVFGTMRIRSARSLRLTSCRSLLRAPSRGLVCPRFITWRSSDKLSALHCQRLGSRCLGTLSARAASATTEESHDQIARVAVERLCEAGLDKDDSAASVRWLMESARADAGVDWTAKFDKWIERRAKREPVQYIIGQWPFHFLPVDLVVRPPVLIPRPETEELVDRIVKSYPAGARPSSLLDIGSGSGAIIVALLHAFPDATGVALEPSPVAAALTEENASRCGVADRLKVVRCTAAQYAEQASQNTFDLIVSNPPYIPASELPGLQPEVRCFEDAGALDGGVDGLDIVRDVLCCSCKVGTIGARVWLEVHHTHPAVFEGWSAGGKDALRGLSLVETVADMYGQPRFVELSVDS